MKTDKQYQREGALEVARRHLVKNVPRPAKPDFSKCNSVEETEWAKLGGDVDVRRNILSDDDRISSAALSALLDTRPPATSTGPDAETLRLGTEISDVCVRLTRATDGITDPALRKKTRIDIALDALKRVHGKTGISRSDSRIRSNEEATWVRSSGELDDYRVLDGDDEEAAKAVFARIIATCERRKADDYAMGLSAGHGAKLREFGIDPRFATVNSAEEARAVGEQFNAERVTAALTEAEGSGLAYAPPGSLVDAQVRAIRLARIAVREGRAESFEAGVRLLRTEDPALWGALCLSAWGR